MTAWDQKVSLNEYLFMTLISNFTIAKSDKCFALDMRKSSLAWDENLIPKIPQKVSNFGFVYVKKTQSLVMIGGRTRIWEINTNKVKNKTRTL